MNCMIAQSGGPTSVINASIYGVIKENQKKKIYENIFGAINGIEGVKKNNFINLSLLSNERLENLKNSPSAALGSCRHKLSDEINEEYKEIIDILNKNNISTFYYIGGNDSMDTVVKLGNYARKNNIKIKFIGIPKTIDNDLVNIDHSPGFLSTAKFIYTSVVETYLDSIVYSKNGVFIMEVMGRDTGWLTMAAGLAKLKGKNCVDLLYIPENFFNIEEFIEDAKRIYKEKKSLYIVVAEGIKDKNGEFISATLGRLDEFGHSQLGGVAHRLKEVILNNKIANKVRVLELNTLQRAAMHCVSEVDLQEAEDLGRYAIEVSVNCENAAMIRMVVKDRNIYRAEPEWIKAEIVANKVRVVPENWVLNKGDLLSKEALDYIKPLIAIEKNYPLSYESFLV